MTIICTKCMLLKPVNDFPVDDRNKSGRCSWCKECYRIRYKLVESACKTRLWSAAKRRAANAGVPFTIKTSDIVIPEYCPILGIKLTRGGDNGKILPSSTSLDKKTPELGYVPGNIQVISHLANSMKQNASQEELHSFASWVIQEVPSTREIPEQLMLF